MRLEPAEDLAIAVAAGQAQRDDEPDHEPVRQPRAVGAVAAGAGKGFFHAGAGPDSLQGAETLAGGPRREGVGLLADVDHRSLLIGPGVVANPGCQEAISVATALDGIGVRRRTAAATLGSERWFLSV